MFVLWNHNLYRGRDLTSGTTLRENLLLLQPWQRIAIIHIGLLQGIKLSNHFATTLLNFEVCKECGFNCYSAALKKENKLT